MLSNETASRYDEQKASWKLILSLQVHHNNYLTRYLKEKKIVDKMMIDDINYINCNFMNNKCYL